MTPYFVVTTQTKKEPHMREMISSNPYLPFEIQTRNKTVLDYQKRYLKIDNLLNNNPQILRSFHKNIKSIGSDEGRNAIFSSDTLLRGLIIRILEESSLRDTSIRLNNDLFLRSFAKIGMGPVPDFRLLHMVEKHLSSDLWGRINSQFFDFSKRNNLVTSEHLRIDTTVCETNIHYPSDSFLLWDSFRVLTRNIRQYLIKNPSIRLSCRFHRKKVRKLYTFISRNAGQKSKRVQQKIKTSYKELMYQVNRLIELSEEIEALGNSNEGEHEFNNICHFRRIAERVFYQAHKRIVEKVKVPASEKIYSIFEEHTEMIKRGKAGKDVEFGHMITIGQTKEKFITYYDCLEVREADKYKIDKLLMDHKRKFGCLPKGLAADKGFYENMKKIKELCKDILTVSIAKKGSRTALEKQREGGKKFKELQKFRAGCEGSISVLKRVFSMYKCLLRSFKNFSARIGHIVFCHNLRLVADMIT